jgi:hypothetical protein
MNGEWWRTNAASQQGNSWCCMLHLVPNSVLADAHQSLMMPGHVGWTLQLWLSSVAREPASCRGLSNVADLRLLCASNHCGELAFVFPSQVGAKCWNCVALLQGAVNVKSVITLHVSNWTTHPHYWQLILFVWDPGGYCPEITNVMLEFEASYRSTQGICSCGASAWSTHCNFILNVGIPFPFPLYVTRSCGKQRKLNGGNVNVVSGVGYIVPEWCW